MKKTKNTSRIDFTCCSTKGQWHCSELLFFFLTTKSERCPSCNFGMAQERTLFKHQPDTGRQLVVTRNKEGHGRASGCRNLGHKPVVGVIQVAVCSTYTAAHLKRDAQHSCCVARHFVVLANTGNVDCS